MVRRLGLASLVFITACSNLRDAVTAHQDVVARVGSHELTVDRVAELLAPAKSVPLRREVLDRVAELWVDYQLLGRAVSGGDSLLDSATVLAANWPAVSQRMADLMHDSVIVAQATLSPAGVDSAYNVGDYRWLFHILVAARQDTTDAVKAAKRRQAEGFLAQLNRGTDFRALAGRVSEDPGSQESGGSLGLVSRGVMVKAFEDAGFALGPGARSGVVETAFGYHIIWRPLLEEVRDSFAAHLKDVVVTRLDSLYLDSLTNRTNIRVRGSAPAIVRAAAENLRNAKERSRVLATFDGGKLRERDFARWLQAYAPQTRSMVSQAPDSTLNEFVRNVARNEMLLRSATEAHISLSQVDRDSIREMYRRDLSLMLSAAGIHPESLAADTSSNRAQSAARRVDGYFAAITATPARKQFFEVPPFLADVLRSRFDWSISPAGVDRALARAVALRGPEEPPPGMGGPGARMTPVPGGRPPVGAPQRVPPPQPPAPRN